MAIFKVYKGELLVGHSELEWGDPAMGCAFGRFFPSINYQTIQKECIENHFDQTALGLSVLTPNNERIICEVVAIMDSGSDEVELNILGISAPPYEELFPEHQAAYDNQFNRED